MKNLTIKYLAISFIIFASFEALAQKDVYQIHNATVSAVGSGRLKSLNPQFSKVEIAGEFGVENQTITKKNQKNN